MEMKDLEALLAKRKEELAGDFLDRSLAADDFEADMLSFCEGFNALAPLLIEMAEALEHYRKVDEFIWQDTSKAAVTLASVAKKLGKE